MAITNISYFAFLSLFCLPCLKYFFMALCFALKYTGSKPIFKHLFSTHLVTNERKCFLENILYFFILMRYILIHSRSTNIPRVRSNIPPNSSKAMPITGTTNRIINPDVIEPMIKATNNATVSSWLLYIFILFFKFSSKLMEFCY